MRSLIFFVTTISMMWYVYGYSTIMGKMMMMMMMIRVTIGREELSSSQFPDTSPRLNWLNWHSDDHHHYHQYHGFRICFFDFKRYTLKGSFPQPHILESNASKKNIKATILIKTSSERPCGGFIPKILPTDEPEQHDVSSKPLNR